MTPNFLIVVDSDAQPTVSQSSLESCINISLLEFLGANLKCKESNIYR